MAKSMNYSKLCEKISKISIYSLVFLFPIFFLPWMGSVLDFNKQVLLIFLVFIAFFSWMLKVLISGKFKFTLSWVHLPLIILFLVLLVSTLFSLYPYGSFWGWPQASSESLITLICFILFYFLTINIFEKKEIFSLITTLIASAFLAVFFGVLQIFGKFLFPFFFSKTTSFTTVGFQSRLAVFTAVLLPLNILLAVKTKKKLLKIFFALSIVLSIFYLILINFSIVWWLTIFGAILVITLMVQKRDILDNRWLILPMVFLAVAILFIFLRFQIPGVPRAPSEIFLNQRAGADIAWRTLKDNPVLGTGPGTFMFDFSKYKDIRFNQTQLWNIRFEKNGSEFLNSLATTGILGILSFLALTGLFIFYGIKILFLGQRKKEKEISTKGKKTTDNNEKGKEDEGLFWVLSAGIFISFLVLTLGYFLYSFSLSLNFLYFLFLAGFIALLFPRKAFNLEPSSLSALTFTFIFTLLFIFSLGIFILEGQRSVALADYQKGVSDWQQNKSGIAVKYMEKAARLNPKVDIYWRQLSQLYLQKINETINNKNLSREDINNQAQNYISRTINSAKAAVDTNPKNVANWSVRAFIYQNLIGTIGGVEDWAIKSYDSALELDPTNPYFPTREGIIFLRQALLLSKDKKAEKESVLRKAENQFKKAISLKPDYAPAHFQLAMTYQAEGKQEETIKKLEATKKIAPFDVGLAFQLGVTYYQNKKYQKAKTELERAVSLNPNYANALYFLGLTYNQIGQNSKAIEEFEKVAKLNPDNPQVKKVLNNLKSGNNPLEGLVKQQPPEAPIKEKQPELKKQPSETEPYQQGK